MFDPAAIAATVARARAVLTVITNLAPVVGALIDQAEQAMPQGGRGAEKLAFVRDCLGKIVSTIEGLQVPFEQVWSIAEPLIALIVKARKSTPAA